MPPYWWLFNCHDGSNNVDGIVFDKCYLENISI